MKHFFALSLFASLLSMAAQNPNYDPDSNGDDLIGAEDLVSLLGVYNTSLAVDTTLECDFDGTAEEEWLFGILTGEVILDSIVVQFSITDSTLYYEPGCPNPQYHILDVELEYVLDNVSSSPTFVCVENYYPNPWGAYEEGRLCFQYDPNSGAHWWYWQDRNLRELRNYTAPYGANYNFEYDTDQIYACSTITNQFFQTFSLDEDGLVGGFRCNGTLFDGGLFGNPVGYNYIRILPYWHYAE